jgi:hypothetical protein
MQKKQKVTYSIIGLVLVGLAVFAYGRSGNLVTLDASIKPGAADVHDICRCKCVSPTLQSPLSQIGSSCNDWNWDYADISDKGLCSKKNGTKCEGNTVSAAIGCNESVIFPGTLECEITSVKRPPSL